jgi:hypothetical protein
MRQVFHAKSKARFASKGVFCGQQLCPGTTLKLKHREVLHMNEQSAQERTRVMQRKKRWKRTLAVSLVPLRLLLAFACGWVLAALFAKSDSSGQIEDSLLLFVGFPPLLGIVAAATVGRRHPHLLSLSIWTGMLVIAGIYVNWLPVASHQDAVMKAFCETAHCHVGAIEVFLLNLFLLYGSVLVLLGSGITYLFLKQTLKQESTNINHASTDEKPT